MKINAEFELEFSMKEDIASIVTNKVVVVTGLYYGYSYIIIIIIIYTNYFEDLHNAKIFLLCVMWSSRSTSIFYLCHRLDHHSRVSPTGSGWKYHNKGVNKGSE